MYLIYIIYTFESKKKKKVFRLKLEKSQPCTIHFNRNNLLWILTFGFHPFYISHLLWHNTQFLYSDLSYPGVSPVRSNSFDVIPGAHPGQPQCPACGVGHLGVTRGAWRHRERANVIVRLAHGRGSPEWALRSLPREANQTHPMLQRHTMDVNITRPISASVNTFIPVCGKIAYLSPYFSQNVIFSDKAVLVCSHFVLQHPWTSYIGYTGESE